MSIQAKKLNAFTKKVADLPDVPTPSQTLSAAQLKAQFDAAPEELRAAFNALIDELSTAGGAPELAASHTHDSRYYSKTQVDNKLLGIGTGVEGLVSISELANPPAEDSPETLWFAILD